MVGNIYKYMFTDLFIHHYLDISLYMPAWD